jgi:hypothetical protein
MADIQIKVPASLGLTDDQLQQLGAKLEDHLVETLKGTQAEAVVAAKPQVIEKSQVVRKSIVVEA